MNLKHLTDDELEHGLHVLVRSERETLTAILYHLLEVNRRRLYSKHKCESLHQYAQQAFGYSESEAGLRITAMSLLKEVPEVAPQIESGSVSLTNLAQAQVHFRKEAKEKINRTVEEKLKLLSKLENCSKSQAKQIIADHAETLFKAGGVQVPLARHEEMPFRPNARLKAKLKRLKELKPGVSLEEIIEQMADLSLKCWDPAERAKRALARKAKMTPTPKEARKVADEEYGKTRAVEANREISPIPELKHGVGIKPRKSASRNRYVKAAVRHQVHLRDEGVCVHCGSRSNLQLDHLEEFARGGSNEIENLRLLCRDCNQRRAIESYGIEKMSSYLKTTAWFYR